MFQLVVVRRSKGNIMIRSVIQRKLAVLVSWPSALLILREFLSFENYGNHSCTIFEGPRWYQSINLFCGV